MAEEAELNLDEELDELENRLERLRALYEQYFLGIEKLEPSVPRKDVERRIWVLRRVKFKNTGKRFKFNVLDKELIKKVVSLGSEAGDTGADSSVFEDGGKGLDTTNCSYTSPKGQELIQVMNLKGSKKVVMITFDTRNWNSYKDKGVLCAWSEGDAPDYMDQAMAEQGYQINKTDWENPRTVLGQKKPFEKTFEERK